MQSLQLMEKLIELIKKISSTSLSWTSFKNAYMPPIKDIKVNSIGMTASQCMHFDETTTLQRSVFFNKKNQELSERSTLPYHQRYFSTFP